MRDKILSSLYQSLYIESTLEVGSGENIVKRFKDGSVIKTDQDGNVLKYNSNGVLIYFKEPGKNSRVLKYDDNGNLIYEYDPDEEYNGEAFWTYDKKNRLIYHKNVEGDEFTYQYDKEGHIINPIATQKAEEYNKKYHGLFIHTVSPNELKNFINLKGDEEVCVSTVRANTEYVHGQSKSPIVLVGFGYIRELYDHDVYSEIGKKGKRYPTSAADKYQTDNLYTYGSNPDPKYYDEGFLRASTADVILASFSPSIEDSHEIKILLKRAYPDIKIIKSEEFNKIKSSELLLRMLYKLKEIRDSNLLMKKTFHKYEEDNTIKFNDYYKHLLESIKE